VAFFESRLKEIVIPSSVEVIGELCFCSSYGVEVVELQFESCLREIGRSAFSRRGLANFEIPPKCEVLTGGSFENVKSVTVSSENPFFVIEDSFVKSCDGKRLIRYLGTEEKVLIRKEVEVIGEWCFSYRSDVREIEFESKSNLKMIDKRAFLGTAIERILIPPGVQSIGASAFRQCQELREVEFEGDLCELGKSAFDLEKVESIKVKGTVPI
jgi:hypothetical protein